MTRRDGYPSIFTRGGKCKFDSRSRGLDFVICEEEGVVFLEVCDDGTDDCELNNEDGAEDEDSGNEDEEDIASVGNVAVKGDSSILSSSSGTVVAEFCELVRPKARFFFFSSNTTGTSSSSYTRRADSSSSL